MRYKIFLRFFIWILLVLGIGLLSLYICLPTIVESQINKRLSSIIDGHVITFKIDKIGLFNATISRVRLNDDTILDQARIFYDLRKLPEVRIEKLIMSGLHIKADLDGNNQLTIQNIELSKGKSGTKKKLDLSFLQYLPNRISIQNSKISLTAFEKQFYIPFDVLAMIQKDVKKIVLQSNVFLFGQKINTQFAYDLNKGPEQFIARAVSFELESLNSLFSKKIKDVKLSGQSDFRLESSKIKTAWSFSSSGVGFSRPLTGDVSNLTCDIKIEGKKIRIDGAFLLSNSLVSNIGLKYSFIFEPLNTYPFSIKLINKKTKNFKIDYNRVAITLQQPEINLEMVANGQKGFGSIHFKSKRGTAEHQQETVQFSSSKLDCAVSFDVLGLDKQFGLKPEMIFKNLNIASEQGVIRLPELHLSGLASYTKNKGPRVVLNINTKNGKINVDDKKIVVTGVEFNLPVQYPEVRKTMKGRYQIAKIVYDKNYAFGVKGKIIQTRARKFKVDGNLDLARLPGVHPQFDLQINLTKSLDAVLDFSIKPFQLTDKEIKKVLPQLKINADIKMTVLADGKAQFLNSRIKTAMNLKIS
ncbi:MAG: hypothetical protein L3J69_11300, partial [Desulfobacula sp.]|nr:hypothetical protein [Desulfobacula sp.]